MTVEVMTEGLREGSEMGKEHSMQKESSLREGNQEKYILESNQTFC